MNHHRIFKLVILSTFFLFVFANAQSIVKEIDNLPGIKVSSRLYYYLSSTDPTPPYEPQVYFFLEPDNSRPVPRLPNIKYYGFKVKVSAIKYYLQATATYCNSQGGIVISKSNMCQMCINPGFPLQISTTFTGKDGYLIARETLVVNSTTLKVPQSNVLSLIVKSPPFDMKNCQKDVIYYYRIGIIRKNLEPETLRDGSSLTPRVSE